jgi:hypothetical protein
MELDKEIKYLINRKLYDYKQIVKYITFAEKEYERCRLKSAKVRNNRKINTVEPNSILGLIYKYEKIDVDGKVWRYIGSTTYKLEERHRSHKHKDSQCSSRILFDKFGYDNCYPELIEELIVSNTQELRAREKYWINQLECVNIHMKNK